ncbi:MAG: DUF3710 domain-containing protein [Bifidobacteriaceae bacterium]|jgi:hypothetical protein|nr:DUF3710 domain-containing protein [Bifidobacteriaceae bacterium]
MALFGRRRKDQVGSGQSPDDPVNDADPQVSPAGQAGSGAAGVSSSEAGQVGAAAPTSGPYDSADQPDDLGRLADFGAIRLPYVKGAKVSLEVSRETSRPVSLVVTLGDSRMQLTAIAAPKSGGQWETLLRQEQSGVAQRGGTSQEAVGPFGSELLIHLPSITSQGKQGKQVLRYIGADGPRWVLQGVIGGRAARDTRAAADLEAIFAGTVVARGSAAMPPGEPLTLSMPAAPGDSATTGADSGQGQDDLGGLLRRGPEITEVR